MLPVLREFAEVTAIEGGSLCQRPMGLALLGAWGGPGFKLNQCLFPPLIIESQIHRSA